MFEPLRVSDGHSSVKRWLQPRPASLRSHLHGDPPVNSVPQTHAGRGLNLVGRRARRLVALPVGAHLQVLVNNVCVEE